jgi:hypothetical protein
MRLMTVCLQESLPLTQPSSGADSSSAWHDAWQTAGTGILVIAFCCVLLLHNPQWFWADDYQSYQLANYRDVARSWHAGEVPLLSPYSWQSGALAGEYQNGVFSIVITSLVVIVFSLGLSLTSAASILSIAHLAILGAGVFRLGRRRGLPADLALMAALATALSGWIMIWGAKAWFPALAAFTWLPWFWWGLDHGLDDRGSIARFLPAGVFLYCIVTAGWPFTVLMAMLLSAWCVLRYRAEHARWLPSWPVVGAWVVGLGLSAPAWLMLLEYVQATERGQTPNSAFNASWTVPLAALPGFVFPVHMPYWNVFGFTKPHMSVELVGGLVPFAAILAAGASLGRSAFRKLGWEIGLAVLILTLAMLPSPGNFRWSFRWLPMFALLLSLIGAHCFAHWRAAPISGRMQVGAWAAILVVAAWVVSGATASLALWHGAVLVGVCALWAGIEGRSSLDSVLRKWMPSVVVLTSCWLSLAFVDPYLEVPHWNERVADHSSALDPTIRYLSVHDWHDLFQHDPTRAQHALAARDTSLWTGNYSLYSGAEFINGYSPMHPRGLTSLFSFRAHGYLGWPLSNSEQPDEDLEASLRLIVAEAGQGDLLEVMGVDGLMISTRHQALIPALLARDWRQDATLDGCVVLHRKTSNRMSARSLKVALRTAYWEQARELTRDRKLLDTGWILFDPTSVSDESTPTLEFAAAKMDVRSESRGTVEVQLTNDDAERESLIVFARPWYPGYRATFNGRPIAVDQLNLIMPAVRLPRGESGTLVLEYRPDSLMRGSALACATIALVLLVAGGAWLSRRRPALEPTA